MQSSYLQTALDAIDSNFASLEERLEQVLGVSAAMRGELQRRFLEDGDGVPPSDERPS